MAEQTRAIALGDYVLYQGVPGRVIAITYAAWGLTAPRLWLEGRLDESVGYQDVTWLTNIPLLTRFSVNSIAQRSSQPAPPAKEL